MTYQLTLPKDPPTLPTQTGPAETFNFQLHPAFWFGMAMCDDQSSPNPGGSAVGPNVPCTPDSDANIYKQPGPDLFSLHWAAPRHGVYGDAVLPAGNGCRGLLAAAATQRSGAPRSHRQPLCKTKTPARF